jgi:hypothetical protein
MGGAQDGGRRRRARWGSVAVARGRLPDVERQGENSGSCVAVGGRIGRRVEQVQGCAELQVRGKRPAAAVTHAQRSRGDRGLGEDDRGPGCKKQKTQGPHCNALITFKPELKCRWAQKQKCRVFQDLQPCFRVHLQKSNSFEINMKLSKVFKLYVNPIDKTTLHIYRKGSFT